MGHKGVVLCTGLPKRNKEWKNVVATSQATDSHIIQHSLEKINLASPCEILKPDKSRSHLGLFRKVLRGEIESRVQTVYVFGGSEGLTLHET
jgi:hypothetical protein